MIHYYGAFARTGPLQHYFGPRRATSASRILSVIALTMWYTKNIVLTFLFVSHLCMTLERINLQERGPGKEWCTCVHPPHHLTSRECGEVSICFIYLAPWLEEGCVCLKTQIAIWPIIEEGAYLCYRLKVGEQDRVHANMPWSFEAFIMVHTTGLCSL